MTNLCVTCDWLDQESVKRWEKRQPYPDSDLPAFNSSYAFCTHRAHRENPRLDMVAGPHMDVRDLKAPPWKKCRHIRWWYGDQAPCPHWKERQNAD